jgi:hypothetical protein
VKSTPDQHDPDWPRYPETVLRFAGDPKLSIDLRSLLSPEQISALSRLGLAEPFAVMTAFDPRGENLTREENDRLAAKLDARLGEMGIEFLRVDACSPDGQHCECSVALKIPRKDAVRLAMEFEQVAIFWFDGEQFWIVGALVETDPIMLPRSS